MNLEQVFQDNFQPVLARNSVDVRVKIETSSLFTDAAKVYSLEADRVMRFTSNERFQITPAEFQSYFETLLWLRVKHVNSEQDATTRLYRNKFRTFVIPAFVSILINSVGIAKDVDFGFRFIPEMNVELDRLMSVEDMIALSDKLSVLNMEGLTCVETGLSTYETGDLNIMAVLNIQGEILSYKKNHPVYGFYAAFFNSTLLADTISPSILRIRYGSVNDYQAYVTQIVRNAPSPKVKSDS